jgi:hypothetical protein
MTPVIAPREPPYGASVTDDLARPHAARHPADRAASSPRAQPPHPLAFSRRTFARRRSNVGARTRAADPARVPPLRLRLRVERSVAGFSDVAGLAEADLHATLQPTAEAPLSRRERLMLAAADELDARKLTPASTVTLRHDLVPAEIVELIALVGRYVRVSMIANTAALLRESGVRPWAGSIK